MLREPRISFCVHATVVSPNFQSSVDPPLVASERLVYGLLIIGSLNFFDVKNMAGMVDNEDAKRAHVANKPDARPRTLIWINKRRSTDTNPPHLLHSVIVSADIKGSHLVATDRQSSWSCQLCRSGRSLKASNREKTMQKAPAITCAFVDIGGVMLTDGWARQSRRRAAIHFKLDLAAMEERHHLNWDIYQAGKLTLAEYLDRVIFHQKRLFTVSQFRRFMFAQSKPHPEMIELVVELKRKCGLRIVVVSNEGRELNAYRIHKFKLAEYVDSFISSCYVGILKPDADIFRLALDVVQVRPAQVVYIENTRMFVEIAEQMGIHGILHTDCASTRAKLNSLGLLNGERGNRATG